MKDNGVKKQTLVYANFHCICIRASRLLFSVHMSGVKLNILV